MMEFIANSDGRTQSCRRENVMDTVWSLFTVWPFFSLFFWEILVKRVKSGTQDRPFYLMSTIGVQLVFLNLPWTILPSSIPRESLRSTL